MDIQSLYTSHTHLGIGLSLFVAVCAHAGSSGRMKIGFHKALAVHAQRTNAEIIDGWDCNALINDLYRLY